jgi:light-regulated signal transduction histidine kinase (bacteriophytochrome)
MQEKEEITLNKRDIISIKKHVNKVEQLIKGVVKFAGAGYEKTLMHPCNLNQILNDYYALINSTLKNKNMECVLDLASYMPNLLTDQGYINQLLVNVFEILGQSKIKSAGILIQTRYINEQINLKILITEVIQEFENPGGRSSFNLRIINNLMKLHEGKFKAEVSPGSGTIIQFSFPVKRRLK